MWGQIEKRTMRSACAACTAFVLAAVGVIVLLCARSQAQPERVLAQAGRWRIERGAPTQTGTAHSVSRKKLLQGTLMLVSPQHPLPPDFPTPNTRAIRAMVGSYLPAQGDVALWQEGIYDLCAMQLEHPLEQGITLIRGTLSPAQQDDWQREAFDRFLKVYPLQEAMSHTVAAVPQGGQSEHQTGYAVDVALKAPLFLGEPHPLRRNETGSWLLENCWRYGWICRYSPGEEAEGSCEGVHLRYVGPVHSTMMQLMQMGLEDYLSLLRQEERLTLYRDDVPYAFFYCTQTAENVTLNVLEDTQWMASADNTGWAVVTIAAQRVF